MFDGMIKYVNDTFGVDITNVIYMVFYIAIILVAMWVLLWINKKVFKGLAKRLQAKGKGEYAHLMDVARKVVKFIIIFICVIAALYQVKGLEQLMTSLLAGSGILAIAIGLASQDAASNLIAGMMVSIFKPFSVGNTIKLVGSGTICAQR